MSYYLENKRIEKIRKEPKPLESPLPKITYSLSDPNELWWCNSHGRRATHFSSSVEEGKSLSFNHCCNPKLGGITLPCFCVNLTGIAEIYDDGK